MDVQYNMLWTKDSVRQFDVRLDYLFFVDAALYVGQDGWSSQAEYEKNQVPLYKPNMPLSANRISYKDIRHGDEELVKHYKDVLTKHEQFKLDLGESTNFRNVPLIKSEQYEISFPWYDDFETGRNSLIEIRELGKNQLFNDIEQGFQLDVLAKDGWLYIHHSDPDSNFSYTNIAINQNDLNQQIDYVIPEVERIIASLAQQFGEDYWTRNWRSQLLLKEYREFLDNQ